MSVVKVNLDNVEGGFEPVPRQAYIVEVSKVEELKSKAGQPYIKWWLKIVAGQFKNRILFLNTSLQPQALFKLKQLLEALDIDTSDGEFELELEEMLGKKCIAYATKTQDPGYDEKNEITKLYPMCEDGRTVFPDKVEVPQSQTISEQPQYVSTQTATEPKDELPF